MAECHDCGEMNIKGSRCPPCREKHRLQERKRKNRLRDEGRCLFCGDHLPDDTWVLCARCRAKRRVQAREGLGPGALVSGEEIRR